MADARPTDDDLSTAADPRRFGRFVPTSGGRKFAFSRAGRLIVAVAILVAILAVGGSTVLNRLVGWITHQPVYSLDLKQVRFVRPVPPWILRGESRLLETLKPFVKQQNSIHDLDLSAVSSELSKNPWVYKVDRVSTSFPNTLSLDVEFRKPVARVEREGKAPIVLDGRGVVLPDDIDLKEAGPLASLFLKKLPKDLTPGLAWPTEGNDDRVLVSVQLAAFLLEHLAKEPDVLPPPSQISLYPENEGLWVELAPGNFLYWGAGPGVDGPKEPSREEKWSMILDRVKKSGPLKSVPDHFYLISKDGLELKARPRPR